MQQRNKYLKSLNKIEFVVTDACTGRCKHCSEGDHVDCGQKIDEIIAEESVKKVAASYDIKTVMTFGGEPLLHTDAVYAIMSVAKQLNIPHRQVITNGYFSKNSDAVCDVAKNLAACGVNDLLLSVDAFHQETIPIDNVKYFAAEVKKCGIPIRLSPAWLSSKYSDNEYNRKTREILDSFTELEIFECEGNVVFPEGNALIYLAEYFSADLPENPYKEDPRDVKCLSFLPNGDVLGGNVYRQDIMEIINNYNP